MQKASTLKMRNQSNNFGNGQGLAKLEKFAQSVKPLELNHFSGSIHNRSVGNLSSGKHASSIQKHHALSVRGAGGIGKDEFFSPKSEISGLMGGSVFKEYQGISKPLRNGSDRLEDFTNSNIEDADKTLNLLQNNTTSAKQQV